MEKSKVRAYVLKNTTGPIQNKRTGVKGQRGDVPKSFGEMDPEFVHTFVAFTTVEYNPDDGLVYCGLTAADMDILWTFDPASKKFASLHYEKMGERFDVKIHRSLILDDGIIYGATAGLIEPFEYSSAPGGKIFSLNPKTKEIKILSIPVPHDYIQTIALDRKQKILYGFTYPLDQFFRYDIKSNRTTNFGRTGGETHIPAVDDDGNLWGNWGCGPSCYILKYNPYENKIHFLRKRLPKMHTADNGNMDSTLNGNDGYIYIGTCSGALMRLDPKNAEVEYLGKPYPGWRMAGLCLGKDGLIYGAGGESYDTFLFAYDREKKKFIDLGRVYDPEINDACIVVHHITITGDRTIYAAETDNYSRSGFLWECKVKP